MLIVVNIKLGFQKVFTKLLPETILKCASNYTDCYEFMFALRGK